MLRRLVGISILVVAILSAHRSSAQSFEEYERQMNARFEQFRTQAEQQYADFYREANARYADYLRREWPEATIQPATPAPITTTFFFVSAGVIVWSLSPLASTALPEQTALSPC